MVTRVFQCRDCKKLVKTTDDHCPSCGLEIDRVHAESAADERDRMFQTCHDAELLKWLARSMPVALLASFLPIVGIAGLVAFFIMVVAVPTLAIRQWIRFRSIRIDDPELNVAKRSVKIALVIWASFPVMLLLRDLIAVIIRRAVRGS